MWKTRDTESLLERNRHTKEEIPERLGSITLNSGFNQKRNVGSNQPQIHIPWILEIENPLQQEKKRKRKNISDQIPLQVYQHKK